MKRSSGFLSQARLHVIAALALASPSVAQTGYAWANEASSAQYQPMVTYSYNSGGGRIAIARLGLGVYSVGFAGLGGKGSGGGHVQVTSYGGGNETCKVTRWNSTAPDFIVSVTCFNAGGTPTDAQFTVLAGWPTGSGSATRGGMPPIPKGSLPDIKADGPSNASVAVLNSQINALYSMIEALRLRINALSR